MLDAVEVRKRHQHRQERRREHGDGSDDGARHARDLVAYEGCRDDDGARGDLSEGDAVHEGLVLHPTANVRDLMKHHGHGSVATPECE